MFFILGIAFASLYLYFFDEQKRRIEIWIEAMIVWCMLLLAKTEILSLFAAVNYKMSLLFWILISVFSMVWIISHNRQQNILMVDRVVIIKAMLRNKLLLLGGDCCFSSFYSSV